MEYRWAEEDGPKSMPAAKYMQRLVDDVDLSLLDEALVPRDGSAMPPHLRPTLSTMLRRLFRVYAHACAAGFGEKNGGWWPFQASWAY